MILSLSFVFSIHHYSSITAVFLLVAFAMLYLLSSEIAANRKALLLLLYWIIGVSTILCIIGVAKRFELVPFGLWQYSEIPYNRELISGSYWNHNHLAGWLEMSIPLLLAVIVFRYHEEWRALQIVLLLFQVLVFILTLSRGGWMSLGTALLFMSGWIYFSSTVRVKKYILLFASISVLILGITILNSSALTTRLYHSYDGVESSTLVTRIKTWRATAEMIYDNWLVGTGPGTFALAFPEYQPAGVRNRVKHAHNDYLHFIAEAGVGVIFIICVMIYNIFSRGFKKLRSRDKFIRMTTLGSLGGIVAILVHSLVDFNLHIPANAALFVVLMSIVAAEQPHRRPL
jgi:O-antigen ligase